MRGGNNRGLGSVCRDVLDTLYMAKDGGDVPVHKWTCRMLEDWTGRDRSVCNSALRKLETKGLAKQVGTRREKMPGDKIYNRRALWQITKAGRVRWVEEHERGRV